MNAGTSETDGSTNTNIGPRALLAEAILGGIFPTFGVMTLYERRNFMRYLNDRLRAEGAPPNSTDDLDLVQRLLRYCGMDVLVVSKRTNSVVATIRGRRTARDGSLPLISPRHPSDPPRGTDAARDHPPPTETKVTVKSGVARMNHQFDLARRRQKQKARFNQFMRTGIRAAIPDEATSDNIRGAGWDGTAGARATGDWLSGIVPSRTDDCRTRVRWSKLSAWHRQRVLRDFVRRHPDGHPDDDPSFAARVLTVLDDDDDDARGRHVLSNPRQFADLPEPVYDHKEGRVVCLAPALTGKSTRRRRGASAGTPRRVSRANAPKSSARNTRSSLLERCRRAREREERLESASVSFVGNVGQYVSTTATTD